MDLYWEMVSDRLKDDFDIVLEAVKENGYSLKWASNRLKDTEIIVLEAIKSCKNSLEFVPERFKK